MNSSWITIPAYLAVQLGFAGLFGTQLAHLRRYNPQRAASRVAAICLLAPLAMLPPTSVPRSIQYISWLLAALVVALFGFSLWPRRWRSRRFALRYGALAMLAVAGWGLHSGPSAPTFILGLLAALAAVLIWQQARA